MRTNIEIDDELMAEAMAASGATTKRDAVIKGLTHLIKLKRQRDAAEAMYGMGWDGDLDEMRIDKPLPSFD